MAQIVKGPADKPGDFNSISDIHLTGGYKRTESCHNVF